MIGSGKSFLSEISPSGTTDNLKPTKPVLMEEGAYEHGSEYGFEVTPPWIRRQAYSTPDGHEDALLILEPAGGWCAR